MAGLLKTQSGWSAATLECLSHAKGAIHRPGVIEASKGDVRKDDKVSKRSNQNYKDRWKKRRSAGVVRVGLMVTRNATVVRIATSHRIVDKATHCHYVICCNDT